MGYKGNNLVGKALEAKRKTPLDDIIDKDRLAEYLGCDPDTITYYQKTMGLPFIPLGRDTYFSIKNIHKWFVGREITLVPEQKKKGMTKTSRGSETEAI